MINYSLLAKAQEYYSSHGFQYIEVPWYVSGEAKNITRPLDKSESEDYKLSVNNKYLIASGEQGFLYLYMKGFLPVGKYCTITPCFRFEEIDSTHKKVFMKCELIHIFKDGDNTTYIEEILDIVSEFFKSIGVDGNFDKPNQGLYAIVNHTEEKNSVDLYYKDTEIGSYGVRSYKGINWVYGTGIAEPRTSFLLNM